MVMTAFGILWFILIAVLIIGYFALDGFDLGVGVLYPFLGKDERTKMMMIRSIGPVWDGNEVWLLTAGGALFAAFPPAYATCFSGFYLAIMLVLFGLIIRAVAVEFRGHGEEPSKLWDACFFIGSLLPALLFGVALGDVLAGIPLNMYGDYTGNFFGLLTAFGLDCGILGLVHMLMQGASWLAAKAPAGDPLRAKCIRLRKTFAIAGLGVFAICTVIYFAMVVPNSAIGLGVNFIAVIGAGLYVASTVGVLLMKDDTKVDIFGPILATVGCAGLVVTVAASMFPYIVPATDPLFSLSIMNSASSDTTLMAMSIIALIGVPLVLVYHVYTYRVFRGRLKEADFSEGGY